MTVCLAQPIQHDYVQQNLAKIISGWHITIAAYLREWTQLSSTSLTLSACKNQQSMYVVMFRAYG